MKKRDPWTRSSRSRELQYYGVRGVTDDDGSKEVVGGGYYVGRAATRVLVYSRVACEAWDEAGSVWTGMSLE